MFRATILRPLRGMNRINRFISWKVGDIDSWRRQQRFYSTTLYFFKLPKHLNIVSQRQCQWGFQCRTMASGTEGSPGGHRNRLGLEKSPYLLQHASNPVDWYPWGEEAFKKAKEENKPIFLSVGYSTCHWCHVMERESFENEDVGLFMNENFVNIKVDREERPDVDRVYMSFVHATTGHGGWPMSVWLTPDLKPFVGGTYFPPDDRYYGRPGFMSILKNISSRWANAREKLDEQGTVVLDALMRNVDVKQGDPDSLRDVPTMERCFALLQANYDEDHGGFGEKPKFPQPVNFNFLLRMYALSPSTLEHKVALKMVTDTLLSMSKGGICDHINKGFHRYSTDQQWHVPHFEKMLYDQAQLATTYADAYQVTKDEVFAKVTQDILEYVNRELSDPSGGFYSAEDADSLPTLDSNKKLEGAFCVWTSEEIDSILKDPVPGHNTILLSDVFKYHFDVKVTGNVDPYQDPHDELKGKNVLIIRGSPAATADKFCFSVGKTEEILEKCRDILYDVRKKRPPPHLDNKMLTAWNGLMISGFARAGQVLCDQGYIDHATKAANFIKSHMYDESTGILLRSSYAGGNGAVTQMPTPIEGFVDDYSFLIRGLIDLYEGSFNDSWLALAEKLQEKQNELFWDHEGGGFFATRADDKSIVIRMKEDHDGAEPCANSTSSMNLLKLSHLLQRPEWQQQALQLMASFSERLMKIPAALPEMVCALMFQQSAVKQIIIAGDRDAEDTRALLKCVYSHYLPNKVLLLWDGNQESFLCGKLSVLSTLERVEGKATAYVCENYSCSLPVNTPEQLWELLSQPE